MWRTLLTPALCSILLLAGCAGGGVKPYRGPPAENLTVDLEMQKGDFGESRGAFIAVSRVGEDCKLDFLGRKRLQRGESRIGLPTGKGMLLEFHLRRKHWLAGGRSEITRKVFLTPERSQEYEMTVSYVDNLFGLQLYRGSGTGREEIESYSAPACLSAG